MKSELIEHFLTLLATYAVLFCWQVSLKISSASTIKQRIVLDADCPYMKFVTEARFVILEFLM